MEVAIQYMVPVTVFVDTETKEVTQALQEYDNIFLPDNADAYDVVNGWDPIKDEAIVEAAIDIAENNEWPVWNRA